MNLIATPLVTIDPKQKKVSFAGYMRPNINQRQKRKRWRQNPHKRPV